jgi:hypothetical protein
MTSETQAIYERLNHVLSTTPQGGIDGLDQGIQMRVKELCMQFLTQNNSEIPQVSLVMMNCELANLLYCMLLENEFL